MEAPSGSESASKPPSAVSPPTSPPTSRPPPPQNASPILEAIPPSTLHSPHSQSPAVDPCPTSSPGSEAVDAIPNPVSTAESSAHPAPLPEIFQLGDLSSPPSAPNSIPEIGQMVCGSCRQLLSYPLHANCVCCMCCKTVNLVLEAHQVGNIKCENCYALLMYPYGAPAVRCSCCRFVTEIGEHNMRPPLSVQQGPPPVSHNPIY